MGEDTIETGVDKLLALFKANERIPLSTAAKRLKVSEEVVQSWVEFLVEERVLGLEYKFTKPYIYMNRITDIRPRVVQNEHPSLEQFKADFTDRALRRHLPLSKVSHFWREHLLRELGSQKEFFIRESHRRELPNPEELWKTYTAKLLEV